MHDKREFGMINSFASLLALVRSYGNWAFLHFGLHCATHQIRVILISGVVITSLFYPALALYSSSASQSQSVSIFGTPSSYGFAAQKDLIDIWSWSSLALREDAVSRARCGVGRTVRVERVLIHSPTGFDEDDTALTHPLLLSTLKLERTLSELVSTRCVKSQRDGRCLVLSPLSFWDHNPVVLLADMALDMESRNVSVGGIPLTPAMVLAWREKQFEDVDYARYLVLTYFFPETDCLSKEGHLQWLDVVGGVVGHADGKQDGFNAEVNVKTEEPFLAALEYHSSPPERKGWTAISALLYFAYGSFAVYVSWSMRQMKTVHSRVGVTFTALVEIAVSTVTSLSVCALVGFKVTMVPWELLPIMILFVGAENMFNLVDAVGKTPVTLPVKQRIAEGLSLAGTSNTLKVVFYNAVLGAIAGVSGGAIRQFCSFAVVVLVAHWFLAHTFFLAVLSIDMQRLELDELLRLDPGLTPVVAPPFKAGIQGKSVWQRRAYIVRALFGARAKKNLSLFLLLATTATLYYATLPSDITPPRPARTRHRDAGQDVDPGWVLWKVLNPTESILHLRVESPTVLTLLPEVDPTQIQMKRTYSRRWTRRVIWLVRIMVLPIGATTVALYGLMLYLLKDTELLEAQKNRAPPNDGGEAEATKVDELKATFGTRQRVFGSDVELVAVSGDGGVVVTVGLRNEVVLWWEGGRHSAIDVADVLLRPSSTVTCVAVDDDGEYFAVGTGSGAIGVWALRDHRIVAFPHLVLDTGGGGVADLTFLPTRRSTPTKTPPPSRPTSPTLSSVPLVAVYEGGVAARWGISALSFNVARIQPRAEAGVIRSRIVRFGTHCQVVVVFVMDDGRVDLQEVTTYEGDRVDLCVQGGSGSAVHLCRTDTRTIAAVSTETGLISLWDGLTGEFIRTLDEPPLGKIEQLVVSSIPAGTCNVCGHLRPDAIALAISVREIVHVFKVDAPLDGGRRCSCFNVNLKGRQYESLGYGSGGVVSGKTSRSASFVGGAVGSGMAFPVSAHGVHSRRASEKDSRRVDVVGDEYDSALSGSGSMGGNGTGAGLWSGANVAKVAEAASERGGWGLSEGCIFGVRRRQKAKPKPTITTTGLGRPGFKTGGRDKGKASGSASRSLSTSGRSSSGLPATTLDRWELWMCDVSDPEARVQASALGALVEDESEHTSRGPLPSSTLNPTGSGLGLDYEVDDRIRVATRTGKEDAEIPRLPFTRVNPFVVARSKAHAYAGFGNTLGVFSFLGSGPS